LQNASGPSGIVEAQAQEGELVRTSTYVDEVDRTKSIALAGGFAIVARWA
jgi:hypothetical protein